MLRLSFFFKENSNKMKSLFLSFSSSPYEGLSVLSTDSSVIAFAIICMLLLLHSLSGPTDKKAKKMQ